MLYFVFFLYTILYFIILYYILYFVWWYCIKYQTLFNDIMNVYNIPYTIYIYTTWCHPTFEGTPSPGLGGFLARVPTDGKSCTRKSTELGIHLGAASLRCLGPHRGIQGIQGGGPGPRAVAMACFPVRKTRSVGETFQKSWICWVV